MLKLFFARSRNAIGIFLLDYSIENYFYTLSQNHRHARYCIIDRCLAKFTCLLSREAVAFLAARCKVSRRVRSFHPL